MIFNYQNENKIKLVCIMQFINVMANKHCTHRLIIKIVIEKKLMPVSVCRTCLRRGSIISQGQVKFYQFLTLCVSIHAKNIKCYTVYLVLVPVFKYVHWRVLKFTDHYYVCPFFMMSWSHFHPASCTGGSFQN